MLIPLRRLHVHVLRKPIAVMLRKQKPKTYLALSSVLVVKTFKMRLYYIGDFIHV